MNHTLSGCGLPPRKEYIQDLKKNWFLPIAAAAYFFLRMQFTKIAALSVAMACVCCVILAMLCPPVVPFLKKQPTWVLIVSAAGALGVCFGESSSFLVRFEASISAGGIAQSLQLMLGATNDAYLAAVSVLYYIGQVLSVLALSVLFAAFWAGAKRLFSRLRFIDDLGRCELILSAAFLILTLIAVVVTYSAGERHYMASAYSSDGHRLYIPSAFIEYAHAENDLRQPLFALFAAPVSGVMYLLSAPFGAVEWLRPVLLIASQLCLAALANVLFAGAVCRTRGERLCFIALLWSVYPLMYNAFLIEQYLFSYFFIALLVYAVIREDYAPSLLCAAGGTLLTGLVLAPFYSEHKLIREPAAWLRDMLKLAAIFIFVMLAAGRGDVIITAVHQVQLLSRFGGAGIAASDKLLQYLNLVSVCVFAPTGVLTNGRNWQLLPVDSISVAGVIILALSVLSFVLDRKNRLSQMAFVWILLSVFLCLVLGWGAGENNMPLYSLYFSWAFLVLLFRLVQRIFRSAKTTAPQTVCCLIGIAGILAVNLARMRAYIDFLLTMTVT